MIGLLKSYDYRTVGHDDEGYWKSTVGFKAPALYLGADGSEVNIAGAAAMLTQGDVATLVGTVASVSGLSCTVKRLGQFTMLSFTLTGVAITHTDAAGSGSSGSLKIFDLVAGAWLALGCRTNLTLTSDTTMDVAGDCVGVFALGTAAANAGDGALTGTEVDIAATKAFTLSSNTLAVGTNITGVGGLTIDGTSTASDIYLNESCTAATSDANGVLTVTGTIDLVLINLGDD